MCVPTELMRLLVSQGTTTIIADPHEIANIKGKDGVKFILEQAKKALGNIYIMLPSCVPATEFEDNGATLTADNLEELIKFSESMQESERILGIAEMMNYPGVLNGDQEVMAKLELGRQMRKNNWWACTFINR